MIANASLSQKAIDATIDAVTLNHPSAKPEDIENGVRHAASLWRSEDGTAEDFSLFCRENYISNPQERLVVMKKLNGYFESLTGHNGAISLDLKKNVDEPTGPIHQIDRMFASFSASAHLSEDLYMSKIAFVVALNFPYYSLEEKNRLAETWTTEEWAAARLGDYFARRIPAELKQDYERISNEAGMYISEYNIHMGTLRDNRNRQLFRDDQILLTHWNLRDELKANYADKENGFAKQMMVFQVMQRIIDQSIPEKVINSNEYIWNPYKNTTEKNGRKVTLTAEPDTRYLHLLNIFKALKAMDPYCPKLNTYNKRNFSGSMEIPQKQVVKIFHEFLSAPLMGKMAELIRKRVGRRLQPFDIWYDGFKSRSSIPEEKLNAITRTRFPNARAFEAAMPEMLKSLGFSADSAQFLASKICVDPARGSGHAWGAQMRSEKSHLRTRIAKTGMDYKGFNIAVHEFGHNVEQTISLHRVPYYSLNGVPNTAFTEALAFLFQKRDLEILGMEVDDDSAEDLDVLDKCWSAFEIMGVSMVDMKVWDWMYAHPETTPAELKAAVISISKEVWNQYFAKAFGQEDQPLLGIYSHMISYPLYLSAYSFGQLIEYQLGQYLENKAFGPEVERIFALGKLTPSAWMKKATGSDLSSKPLLLAAKKALARIKK